MKRDMDLIRNILFYVEDHYKAGQMNISIDIDGVDENTIYEHCKLVYQSGLLQSFVDLSTDIGASCMVGNLTSEGYDYLDKIRSDSMWHRVCDILRKKALPFTIDIIKTVATDLILEAIQ